MIIVQVTPDECWIGETVEACVMAAAEEHGENIEDSAYDGAEQLTDEQLDTFEYFHTDEDETPYGKPKTFREQLAREIELGGTFPRLFGSRA